jgi:signal transduction histidine kinase/ligand-binding sensor domain-containing protein
VSTSSALFRIATTLAWTVLAWCPSAFALNPELDVSQYTHTAWRIRDGLPTGSIYSIVQTPDGYLWLAADFGLFRFDGVRSVPWRPPHDQRLPAGVVRALLVTRDGALLIGTETGLARWKEGTLTVFETLAGRHVGRLLEDRDGVIWMTSSAQSRWTLCAIRSGTVECYGEDGGPGADAVDLYEDTSGRVWVGTQNGLWRWTPGPARFYPLMADPNGIQGFSESDDGSLLIAFGGAIQRFVDGKAEPAYPFPSSMQPLHGTVLLRDRDGGLWFGMTGGGLLHMHQGLVDVFAQSDGLSGDWVTNLFEDREGNVWVATQDGLDRFHEATFVPFSARQGLSNGIVTAVLGSRDGSVWLATSAGVNRWQQGRLTSYRDAKAPTALASTRTPRDVRVVSVDDFPRDVVYSMLEDRAGRVWLSTRQGVGYVDSGRFVPFRGLPAGVTRAIVEDGQGSLWIAKPDSGLFRVDPVTRTIDQTPWATFGDKGPVSALAADSSQAGVWVGFFRGDVAFFRDGRLHASYTAADGLAEGRVSALRLDREGALWAATDGGVTRLKDGRIATLTSRNGLPCDAVQWTVEDDDGSLWVFMRCGFGRIARSEVNAWIAAADKDKTVEPLLRVTVFDGGDGFRAFPGPNYFGSPVARSGDGKLWFISPDGASVVDLRHLPLNTLAPPVHIEQVTADRRTYERAAGDIQLPALIRDLQIDYTALSFVAPEKNRFRVKLEGWDRDWQDVGTRRQAFYSNLPPRSYRFRVMASNNNGVWNEVGASLDFSVAPAYYQTTWFRLSVVGAFLLLLTAAYQMRVRHVARAFNMRLEERVHERTRIARELHDTLLQSFHGLLFRFQAATNRLPDSDVKRQFETAIDQAAQAITEGRDAVQHLRASTTVTNDLAEAISTLGAELAAAPVDANAGPPGVDVAVEGTPRDLHPILRDDIYRIAGEALRNAFRHARARRIEVEIRYDDAKLQVRVRDDGQGIDPAMLAEQRSGHFGLRGMRERAELIGGHVDVWSRVGFGTEVELTIPARAAYATLRPRWRSGLFAGKTGAHS